MNILIVSDVYDNVTNGVARSLHNLIDELKKKDKVVLITSNPFKESKVTTLGNCVIYRYPSLILKQIYSFTLVNRFDIANIMRKHKIDLCYVSTFSPLAKNAYKACKDSKIACVYAEHMIHRHIFYVSWIARNLLKRYILKLHTKILAKFDGIVCVSKRAYEKAIKLNPSSIYISNGAQIIRKIRECKTAEHNKTRILYVGRLSKEKNIESLIIATNDLDNSHTIDIVGAGDRKSRLQRKIKNKNIKLRGYLDEISLNRVYDSADIFVLPSFMEAEGLVLYEAMSRGVPTIVSNRIDIVGDLLIDGQNCLLFDPYSPRALHDCIIRLRNDKGLRDRIIMNAYDLVDSLSIDKTADRLRIFFHDVMVRKKSG